MSVQNVPPAGDGNGGWKQKEKVPKTLDFIGFSALWMAHPEELESPTYCLGGGRSILLSYKCTATFIIRIFAAVVKLRRA